jgi:hypothetical protein
MYSFLLFIILFQLAKRHNGINNVVNKTKKIEIPSIPNEKLKFNEKIQNKSKIN